MMDLDAFAERAAIKEFCGGMSRFQAETEAAEEQGFKRFEVIHEIGKRHPAPARHHGSAADGNGSDNMPGVQRNAAQQDGHLPERQLQA